MAQIAVSHLTFAYEGSYNNIFEDVSFRIDTDWKLGFIGRNGRGKTTFLNLLQGKYEYKGSITSPVPFEYFPYHIPDKSRITSEILDELCSGYELWRVQQEMDRLEVGDDILYRPFGSLSNGEQTKMMLCLLLQRSDRFLLIDEPTNHLDMHGRETVSRYLNSKKGFILVSHDRAFLDGCVDHVLSINKADIEIQQGNFSTWQMNRERQDAFEWSENEKLIKEITRLRRSAAEKAQWAEHSEREKIGADPNKIDTKAGRRPWLGEKSRKANKRAKAIEGRQEAAIEEKTGLLKNIERAFPVKIIQLPYSGSSLMQLRDIALYYGKRQICSGVTFEVKPGSRIALTGKNGCGKTSLLKLLCGENIRYTGSLVRPGRLKISYVPQDASGLRGTLAEYALRSGVDEERFRAMLGKLDFSGPQYNSRIEDYSDGQKKKVLLARSLCEDANLFIWDEPLNFVDVLSRIQIENAILTYQPAIIFVEHDRVFCDRTATEIVEIGFRNQQAHDR